MAFDDLTARQAYELWQLRQDVFVVEQASPYRDLDGRDLEPRTRHVLAHDGDTLVGCLRLVDQDDHLQLGRVVVAREARRTGLSRRLLAAALELCPGREVRLDAQVQLAGFYGQYGFEVTGPEFDDAGIPHLPMTRPSTGQRPDLHT